MNSFEGKTLGEKQRVISSASGTVTVDYYAIAAPFGDVVLSSATLKAGVSGGSLLSGVTLGNGNTALLSGKAIALTSGTAILYLD